MSTVVNWKGGLGMGFCQVTNYDGIARFINLDKVERVRCRLLPEHGFWDNHPDREFAQRMRKRRVLITLWTASGQEELFLSSAAEAEDWLKRNIGELVPIDGSADSAEVKLEGLLPSGRPAWVDKMFAETDQEEMRKAKRALLVVAMIVGAIIFVGALGVLTGEWRFPGPR